MMVCLCGCSLQRQFISEEKMHLEQDVQQSDGIDFEDLAVENQVELQYANQFQMEKLSHGYVRIAIENGGVFLLVPEGENVPNGVPEDITILKQPKNIYLLSTSVMDLFRELDGIDCIKLTGTKEADWKIEEAKQAMLRGDMVYAGKYNAPDYECILSNQCDLAIENTMILHNPEVKEQLERFGIPVLVERSSYESHPLGRMEWIKLYGVLLGKEQEANAFFESKVRYLEDVLQSSFENTSLDEKTQKDSVQDSKKTVAFFYITSNGAVNVRKSGDYVSKMIELTGGEYIFHDLADENNNSLSTMRIQMEAFYATAKDADYLIYNSTIDGEIKSLEELMEKSELIKDFKAVQTGDVWCTEKNLFQESTGIVDFMVDLHRMVTEEKPENMNYMFRLK